MVSSRFECFIKMVKEKAPRSVQNEAGRGFCNRIVKPIASTLRDRDAARRVPKFRFLHVVESRNDMQLRWDLASQDGVFTGNKCRFRRAALNGNPVFVCRANQKTGQRGATPLSQDREKAIHRMVDSAPGNKPSATTNK